MTEFSVSVGQIGLLTLGQERVASPDGITTRPNSVSWACVRTVRCRLWDNRTV